MMPIFDRVPTLGWQCCDSNLPRTCQQMAKVVQHQQSKSENEGSASVHCRSQLAQRRVEAIFCRWMQ